jgi:NADPH2:quinone reductase
VSSGELRIRVDRAYPLAEAAQAHRDLEGRHTAGKLLLIPG